LEEGLVGSKYLYPLLAVPVLPFSMPHRQRTEQIIFFLVLVVLPIELILFSNLKQGYWFVQRHFIWVMPWFAFGVGWAFNALLSYALQTGKGRRDQS
jgi:hypothetical protein